MNLFVGQSERLSSRRDNRRVEFQTFEAARRIILLHGGFDAAQDQLAGGTASTGSEFVKPAM